MSNVPGEGLAPKPELPTPEQLNEFSGLVTDIIANSKNVDTAPIDPEDPESAFVLVAYDLSKETSVTIGRNNGLIPTPDTVDVGLSNIFKGMELLPPGW